MASHSDKFVCLDDFEVEAHHKLPTWFINYYATGSDEEHTLKESRKAFKRYRLRPRILRDVSQRDLSTTILGLPISFPVCIAPTAFHRCANVEGEKATARAARKCGTVMVQSMVSNSLMADVAMAAPGAFLWQQVYIMKNLEVTKHFVREAERCGFKGIVLTIDSPQLGNHSRTSRRRMASLVDMAYKLSNFDIPSVPEMQEYKKSDPQFVRYIPPNVSPQVTIKDIIWLKNFTKLPIICKGVLTAEGARELAEAGVDGILVSAHGGRQLDFVPPPIDVLSQVVEAVRGYPVEVYMDGGVRTGTDVFKAMAMGARAVFIGRSVLWGLSCNGQAGVEQVLNILREEFSLAMALCGCTKLSDIQPSMVVHESYYHSKL